MLQGLTKSVFPEQAESFSVVSNGAECIMISKKFFLEKANEATMLHLRQVVRTRTRRVVLSLSVSTLIIVVLGIFFIYIYFSVRLLSVLCGHSVFSSPPQRPMTSDFEGFSIPDFIHYIYFPILILEKEPVFPFLMFSAKQGNYNGTIFITSLV